MRYIKRLLYLMYYMKNTNREQVLKFMKYVKKYYGIPFYKQSFFIVSNSLRYNISIAEYYLFHFYKNKPPHEKKQWAGTGYMFEYQKKMNPLSSRKILEDKRLFYRAYSQYINHKTADIESLEEDPQMFSKLINSKIGLLVFKIAKGNCGHGLEIKKATDFKSKDDLINYMKTQGFGTVEEFVVQHKKLQQLSPIAVNTLRIVTQLTKDNEVEIVSCVQRIAIGTQVDNLAAGNIAAPIDMDTGIIYAPGIYSDITKPAETYHPVTGVKIIGFEIPFWKDCLHLVKKVAGLYIDNKSVGWDFVITENGPDLIEGNHDWCKLVFQLPINTGKKEVLNSYLSEINA